MLVGGGGRRASTEEAVDVQHQTSSAHLSPSGLASMASAEHTLRQCELAPMATSCPWGSKATARTTCRSVMRPRHSSLGSSDGSGTPVRGRVWSASCAG